MVLYKYSRDLLSALILFHFFPIYHLALSQRGTSGCEEEATRRTAAQTQYTSLRGLNLLFQDLTDKRQAGNPTIEVEQLKPNVCESDLRKF